MPTPINIAIFASGNGTNMQAITDYFTSLPDRGVVPALVLSDNPSAFVLERAKASGIPAVTCTRSELQDAEFILSLLRKYDIRYIILAGYLRLVPLFLLEAFPGKILNIHPALLPKYGGKGMYGHHVHEAVKAAGEHETGITIHEIDEEFDRGSIVFQAKTAIDPERDSPDDIASKVHLLEHRHFPKVIDLWITQKESEH